MQFSEESIDRFRAIYERKYNEPITREEAVAMARRLVNLYRLFLRPLPPEVTTQLREESERAVEGLDSFERQDR